MIPATKEAEAGGQLVPRRWGTAYAAWSNHDPHSNNKAELELATSYLLRAEATELGTEIFSTPDP